MAQMIAIGDLKKGMIMEFDGGLYEVVNYEHFKLGKGNSEARIRLKLKDLRTGVPSERVFQTSDHLPRTYVESHKAQYLYEDHGLYYFMDGETFEQSFFPQEQLQDILPFLKEEMEVDVLVHGNEAISVRLPITVTLKVVETPPGFKGDTASAGTKPARLETGLTLQVPFFVSEGDVIKVDTRVGQYLERVG
jgi:elongation factor P